MTATGQAAVGHGPRLRLVKGSSEADRICRLFGRVEAAFNRALVQPGGLERFSAATRWLTADNPHGVASWRSRHSLVPARRRGVTFSRGAGGKSVRISSLAVTRLDEIHSVVRAVWEMRSGKGGAGESAVTDEMLYVVQNVHGRPRILSAVPPGGRVVYGEWEPSGPA